MEEEIQYFFVYTLFAIQWGEKSLLNLNDKNFG